MPSILLTTLNARYMHTALGLRYLFANMGALQTSTLLKEYTIEQRPADIVESILQHKPVIIGFGVYIWNIEQTTKIVALLKQVQPEIVIVLGGPEVSYEYEQQDIARLADYVVTGAADKAFGSLCSQIMSGSRPAEKILTPLPVTPDELAFPYDFYTAEDIAHRVIYVEASRGCPYKCEFCLSALDKSATPFDLDRFLAQAQRLYDRGVRRFKFVDRTFNLKVDTSLRILKFFLQRMDDGLFLHFELVPDRLPDALKETIKKFPPGSLQFEIGIQSLDPTVQALISRRQDNVKSIAHLTWLRSETHAHLHTDLIFGLPGETPATIARGFDQLVALEPHEIQLGILKRLRGAPIARHTDGYGIKYNPHPPYDVLATAAIDFDVMQRLKRFARYWDMIANAGRFHETTRLILADRPFDRFLMLSDWLFDITGQTHRIALVRLFDLLLEALTGPLAVAREAAVDALRRDHRASGLKSIPAFLTRERGSIAPKRNAPSSGTTPGRQIRHLKV